MLSSLFLVFLMYSQLVLINPKPAFFQQYMAHLSAFARLHLGIVATLVHSRQITTIIKGRIKNRLRAPNMQGEKIFVLR